LAGLAVLVTAATSGLLVLPPHALLPQDFPLTLPALLAQFRFSLVPTVAVLTLYETIYFFEQWKTSLRQAEELGRAQNQAQLDALQGQLDPHFLFNNLNTLSALIEPGNAPAQDFVEQLADVYRYVLLAQGRATVPLAEELAFVETYLALHKARFRDNLQIEVNIVPAALSRHVAPLSVQLLVENALKHNVASREHPLHLRLAAASETPEVLVVENTRRP
ncbi:sensor histidine kinase, partial [Hymenobacter agri]